LKKLDKRRLELAPIILGALAFFAPWAAYTQLGIGLTPVTISSIAIICYWFFVTIATGRLEKPDTQTLCVVSILIIAGASYFWSLSPNSWFLQYYYYLLCYLTFLSTRHFIVSEKAWNIIVVSLIFGSLVGVTMIASVESDWGVELERQTIDGLNSNYVAYVLAGAVSLSLIYGFKNRKSKIVWPLIFLFIAIVVYKIALLGTRGAMLSVLLLLAWTLFFRATNRMAVLFIFWSALIALALVSAGIIDILILGIEAFVGVRDTGDLSGRLLLWPNARNIISEAPFLGIGIGAFPSVSILEIGAHNVFLTMLLELGAVGFIFFACIIFYTLSPGLKRGAPAISRFAAGAFICYWVPIALSGHWELAIASWLILALHYLVIDNNSHANKF